MVKYLRSVIFWTVLCLAALSACQVRGLGSEVSTEPTFPDSPEFLPEIEVHEIPLAGPASGARAEISGMAWCGEELVLLPQYPDRFEEQGSANVFGISQNTLAEYFSGDLPGEITPELIPFDTGNLEQQLPGFEGFEAIVFNGSNFFVSIEARQAGGMMGYLVRGTADQDCSHLVIDTDLVVSLPPQADIGNMSHETLIIYQNKLYAIYEANGVNVNPNPVAHVFDLSLESQSIVDFPNIEYRVTDAAVPDEQGEFWAVNYFFPGDTGKLEPAPDQIALKYGVGMSHQDADPVERLVKFRIGNEKIQLADQAPLYLELSDGDSRNWEGIVQYGDGFLLVTDKFPTTIFGYVEVSN